MAAQPSTPLTEQEQRHQQDFLLFVRTTLIVIAAAVWSLGALALFLTGE